jgi:beta-N-acetylhexosaminidase
MKKIFFGILFLIGFQAFTQNVWTAHFQEAYQKTFEKKYFVDSVFQQLNDDEKIGQLFMVAAYSNRDSNHVKHIDSLVEKYAIGGLIFFQGGPLRQAQLNNRFQQKSRTPLFIAIDGEWGLSMRLDSTIRFPKQLTLGAIQDNTLIYEMGKTIAKECRRMGIHINFAPDIDINNNPKNPVINDRSFGEDPYNVALKGLAYAKGMQDHGVMACAKHFPGHGDTDTDSHYSLPVINKSLEQLDKLELYPFKVLFNEGVHSVMAAHLFIPAIDNTKDVATSLSYKSTTELLKKQMGFNGLVFSDALNMKGVSKFFKPGEVELKAFKAGNDVLLFAEDVPKAIALIKNAVEEKEISWQQINTATKKILSAKYDYKLFHEAQLVELNNLYEDINNIEAQLVNRKLFESALTYISHEKQLLPFQDISSKKFLTITIGNTTDSIFQQTLNLYANIPAFSIDKNATALDFQNLYNQTAGANEVIVALFDMSRHNNKNYGLTDNAIQFINNLAKEKSVSLVVFGNPYSLKYFDNVQHTICVYEENTITKSYAAQLIFGGVSAKGTLPVSASSKYTFGAGNFTPEKFRLKYTMPEEVGIASKDLLMIDSIANKAIAEKMTPGCQIVFAKDGKVFYNKSFGHHTYDSIQPVKNTDVYDIASITKIAATTLSLMKLYDDAKIDLDQSFSHYLILPKNNTVGSLKIKEVLLHQAGLGAWIPFYASYLSAAQRSRWFRMYPLKGFTIQVADSLYTKHDMYDTIYKNIYFSKVEKKPEYKYSDLGFYIFPEIIEKLSGKNIDEYTKVNFYEPLGLRTTTYNPLRYFSANTIVPTENDTLFRKQLIRGFVHDPGAALLGGVSGHAGLFSNAGDIAILMQMLLNKGSYAGKQFIKPETVDLFTKSHLEKNRRGFGFDKPEIDTAKTSPTAKSASLNTFGHSGFTGTCTWADSDNNLVYVFLSNRVYPSAANNKLAINNVRTDIMQVVYNALKKNEN